MTEPLKSLEKLKEACSPSPQNKWVKGWKSHGKKVSKDALQYFIGVYNRTRKLLREIYQERKGDRPSVSGTEALEIVRHASRIPREAYNEILGKTVEEVQRRPAFTQAA